MSRKIASHYALINGRLERGIVVSVDDNNTITDVSQHDNIDSLASVEFFPGVLIPGMINAHCHLELAYLSGAIAEGAGFAGFAREIGRVRGNYTTEERLRAASVADARMWEEGVAAVVDIANDELVMPIKERSHIEYHTRFELFGLGNTSFDSLTDICSRHERCSVTPHSTYSVQDAPFRAIADSGNEALSIHFLESAAEGELYQRCGSLWEWYSRMGWECDFLGYGSPTKRIVESIPQRRSTLLVHNAMASDSDVKMIGDHFTTPATWVLCPESNRYISGITPPVDMLRQTGARIAIGTDSLASARTLSMIDNMRLLGNIPLEEMLSYATINGAQALGIDDRMGSIEVGKRPGLAVIEGVDLSNMTLTPDSQAHRIV
jgi:cytosine/adenosine deaminase-related metal-dependent hydrolase